MQTKMTEDNEAKSRKNSDLFQKRQMQIVMKAANLFMEKGYAQTSMREISKATEIDISYLYHFIESKEDILFRVFEMLHRPELELFEDQRIINIDDPIEQLRTVIRGLVNSGYNYEREILLMYRESKALPKHLLKIIMAKESKVVAQIEEILKKGMERKVFHFEDASFTANMIVFELSVHAMRNWNMKKYPMEELIDLIEKHVMRAVMA